MYLGTRFWYRYFSLLRTGRGQASAHVHGRGPGWLALGSRPALTGWLGRVRAQVSKKLIEAMIGDVRVHVQEFFVVRCELCVF